MEELGEGDVYIIPLDIHEIEDQLCRDLLTEVCFSTMINQGFPVPRLIAIQSITKRVELSSIDISDNYFGGNRFALLRPLYRHPNDEEPDNIEMVPVIRQLLSLVEYKTGITGLNHVLIQRYRDGKDNIQMHSDKTLDLHLQTPIINVSFGAERTMKLRRKCCKSDVQLIPLRHGESLVFGLKTNQFWYHEVPKKMDIQPHAHLGIERISLTFRRVETFTASYFDGTDREMIVGQGSPFPTVDAFISHLETTKKEIGEAVGSDQPSNCNGIEIGNGHRLREGLIAAFSKENKLSDEFDWNIVYGEGFLCR